jgi:hypothetical protein
LVSQPFHLLQEREVRDFPPHPCRPSWGPVHGRIVCIPARPCPDLLLHSPNRTFPSLVSGPDGIRHATSAEPSPVRSSVVCWMAGRSQRGRALGGASARASFVPCLWRALQCVFSRVGVELRGQVGTRSCFRIRTLSWMRGGSESTPNAFHGTFIVYGGLPVHCAWTVEDCHRLVHERPALSAPRHLLVPGRCVVRARLLRVFGLAMLSRQHQLNTSKHCIYKHVVITHERPPQGATGAVARPRRVMSSICHRHIESCCLSRNKYSSGATKSYSRRYHVMAHRPNVENPKFHTLIGQHTADGGPTRSGKHAHLVWPKAIRSNTSKWSERGVGCMGGVLRACATSVPCRCI